MPELIFTELESGGLTLHRLQQTGMIDTLLTSESGYVELWTSRPESYPVEYRDKVIVLWRSHERHATVPCLVWKNNEVKIENRSVDSLHGKVYTLKATR